MAEFRRILLRTGIRDTRCRYFFGPTKYCWNGAACGYLHDENWNLQRIKNRERERDEIRDAKKRKEKATEERENGSKRFYADYHDHRQPSTEKRESERWSSRDDGREKESNRNRSEERHDRSASAQPGKRYRERESESREREKESRERDRGRERTSREKESRERERESRERDRGREKASRERDKEDREREREKEEVEQKIEEVTAKTQRVLTAARLKRKEKREIQRETDRRVKELNDTIQQQRLEIETLKKLAPEPVSVVVVNCCCGCSMLRGSCGVVCSLCSVDSSFVRLYQ